jgi:malate dehydrogenase (oxaloacetate-decarboxylating)
MKVVINGAGAAGGSLAKLLNHYGVQDIVLCDTHGAIYEGRKEGMNSVKEKLAKITNKKKIKGKL